MRERERERESKDLLNVNRGECREKSMTKNYSKCFADPTNLVFLSNMQFPPAMCVTKRQIDISSDAMWS